MLGHVVATSGERLGVSVSIIGPPVGVNSDALAASSDLVLIAYGRGHFASTGQTLKRGVVTGVLLAHHLAVGSATL
jgi:hypothetical protein